MIPAQLVSGWEAILAIGIILLVLGIGLAAAKKGVGKGLAVMGVLWLIAFGIYFSLLSAGVYPEGGAVTDLHRGIGAIIVILGLLGGIYAVRASRKARGG